MTSHLYIKCILLIACLSVQAVTESCPYKECKCKRSAISCNELGLTEIPPLTGDKTGNMYLQMETNNITTIPAGSLPPNLTGLDMLRNPITTIDFSVFNESLNTLETLSFSEALFARISDAILPLRALKSFFIYDTFIQDWNKDAMKNIGSSVEILYLINVSLSVWPSWIQYFTHITELSIEFNTIAYIPDDALDMLANSLTTLDLSKNLLAAVPKTISKLTALQSLSLDFNNIVDITWLPQVSTLSQISLMNNNITDVIELSKSLRPSADTLMDVDVTANNLSEIPDLSFLTRIDYLDFSNNQISDPFSGSLSPIVTFLALDYNLLSRIPRLVFNLTSLGSIQMTFNVLTEINGADIPVWIRDIELSYNRIIELTERSFPPNSNIWSLSLVSNPIATISADAFENLKSLTSLNIQNSKLTRLPMALTSLTSLTWFDINGSLDLVCTCMEKSIGAWFLSRQTGIGGKCGETDIYVFFANMSQACP